MLPGEEFMVERWYNNALLSWHNSALNFRDSRSWLLPPHGDGSNWWFNPQVVSTILLSVIAILLGARFGSEAKSAPRRIARRIRKAGSRIKPLVLRPREVSHTAVLRGKRALRRFTQPREERAADDFVDARPRRPSWRFASDQPRVITGCTLVIPRDGARERFADIRWSGYVRDGHEMLFGKNRIKVNRFQHRG